RVASPAGVGNGGRRGLERTAPAPPSRCPLLAASLKRRPFAPPSIPCCKRPRSAKRRAGMRRLARWCLLITVAGLATAGPAVAGDKGLVDSETFSGFQFNFNNPGAR